MAALFDRRCVVLAGRPPGDSLALEVPSALKIDGLRVEFKIEKSEKHEPNSGEILIYNLAPISRAALEGKGIRCVLSAGYADTVAQIFSGDVLFGSSEKRNGVDWVTKLQLGDGRRVYDEARVSQTWGAGTSVQKVVEDVIGRTGIDGSGAIATAVKKLAGKVFSKGYTAHGSAMDELQKLMAREGLQTSIQDGQLQVTEPDQVVGSFVPLVSPDSGLIGTPSMGTPEKKGGRAFLKLRSLLQPAFTPASKFKLESASHRGFYRVHRVRHAGDTSGGDWYSDIEATPL